MGRSPLSSTLKSPLLWSWPHGAELVAIEATASNAMFVILIYDIASREFKEKDNSRRIRKTIEKYLPRVQLSVYEGEIRESDLKKLKSLLQRSADSALDSIILYEFKSLNYSKRTVIGIDKLQAIFD